MAENVEKDEVSSSEEIREKADLDLEKATIEHEFSSPWDDSDLVLVVEDQKLHVHRCVLKMTSPVFKAMLSSNFKEKDANEITLPGKKLHEFVDFLRQIYPLLDGEITLKNVDYIYRLADEYQMTKVMKQCRIFLSSVRKTEESAMDMLLIAQDIKAEEARQQCYDVLKKMTWNELENLKGFSELDRQSMQALVLPAVKRLQQSIERLQQCIKRILPEVLGSMDETMFLWSHEKTSFKMGGVPPMCPLHKLNRSQASFSSSIKVDKMYKRIKCDECRAMFKQMARNAGFYYKSPSDTYLSEGIVNVLEEMMELTKESMGTVTSGNQI